MGGGSAGRGRTRRRPTETSCASTSARRRSPPPRTATRGRPIRGSGCSSGSSPWRRGSRVPAPHQRPQARARFHSRPHAWTARVPGSSTPCSRDGTWRPRPASRSRDRRSFVLAAVVTAIVLTMVSASGTSAKDTPCRDARRRSNRDPQLWRGDRRRRGPGDGADRSRAGPDRWLRRPQRDRGDRHRRAARPGRTAAAPDPSPGGPGRGSRVGLPSPAFGLGDSPSTRPSPRSPSASRPERSSRCCG